MSITEDWNNINDHCCLNRFNLVLLVLIHIKIETNVGRLLHQIEMFDVGYDAKCYYFTNLVDAYPKLQHQTKNHLRTQICIFQAILRKILALKN